MKIQLKNFKKADFASEETLCFEASLYIDGKRVGYVSNDGHGGSHLYGFNDRETEKRFYDYCKTVTEPCDCRFARDGECFLCKGTKKWNIGPDGVIDRLVTELEREKADKKNIRAFKKRGYGIVVRRKVTDYETEYAGFRHLKDAEQYVKNHGNSATVIAGSEKTTD